MTSSTWSNETDAFDSAPLITALPRAGAGTSANAPPKAPMAVRAPAARTTVVLPDMTCLSGGPRRRSIAGRRQRASASPGAPTREARAFGLINTVHSAGARPGDPPHLRLVVVDARVCALEPPRRRPAP